MLSLGERDAHDQPLGSLRVRHSADGSCLDRRSVRRNSRRIDMSDLFGGEMEKGAVLSDCGKYRYVLWRRWDTAKPRLIFIMLNPSIADAEQDDATIRVCMGRARRMDMGGIHVLNLFAFRATDPTQLDGVADPVGPENDRYIEKYLGMRDFDGDGQRFEMMIAAWGDGGLRPGLAPTLRSAARADWARPRRERWREVVSQICGEMGDRLFCLGTTKAGQPKHPLRISYDVAPTLWMDRERYRGLPWGS